MAPQTRKRAAEAKKDQEEEPMEISPAKAQSARKPRGTPKKPQNQEEDQAADTEISPPKKKPTQSSRVVRPAQIQSFFYKYARHADDDKDDTRIGPNGVMQLLNDMKLDATDIRVLLLAFKLKAETQCEFSKEEFVSGMMAMKINRAPQLKDHLAELKEEILKDDALFRELYVFAFHYGQVIVSEYHRNLELETAIAYWNILLGEKFPVLTQQWEEFLMKNHGRAISKDIWMSWLDFCQECGTDGLENYDESGSWPCIIDDFVTYTKNQPADSNM